MLYVQIFGDIYLFGDFKNLHALALVKKEFVKFWNDIEKWIF